MGREQRQRKKRRKLRNQEKREETLLREADGTMVRRSVYLKERRGDEAVVDLEFTGRPVVVDDPETDDLKAKDALQKHLWDVTDKSAN
jgi:hypothetical protein